jgi:hypothetical protein
MHAKCIMCMHFLEKKHTEKDYKMSWPILKRGLLVLKVKSMQLVYSACKVQPSHMSLKSRFYLKEVYKVHAPHMFARMEIRIISPSPSKLKNLRF